jgi:hypothetical protein
MQGSRPVAEWPVSVGGISWFILSIQTMHMSIEGYPGDYNVKIASAFWIPGMFLLISNQPAFNTQYHN